MRKNRENHNRDIVMSKVQTDIHDLILDSEMSLAEAIQVLSTVSLSLASRMVRAERDIRKALDLPESERAEGLRKALDLPEPAPEPDLWLAEMAHTKGASDTQTTNRIHIVSIVFHGYTDLYGGDTSSVVCTCGDTLVNQTTHLTISDLQLAEMKHRRESCD
jgi:hypothetical protein